MPVVEPEPRCGYEDRPVGGMERGGEKGEERERKEMEQLHAFDILTE